MNGMGLEAMDLEVDEPGLEHSSKPSLAQGLWSASEELSAAVDALRFAPPVTHTYNPLRYAAASHKAYLARFAAPTKHVLFVGMNPGPFGMAQTGVPFGEVGAVRDWMGIEEVVGRPAHEHAKRPIEGFACSRSEVSGARLWGWANSRFGNAENFFERCFVYNYCPLVFMEESGKNRTPDKLPKDERRALFGPCDRALQRVSQTLEPSWVIGIGAFARRRIDEALANRSMQRGTILHPSPASPRANQGWASIVDAQLADLGVKF